MKHINQVMENLDKVPKNKSEENISIVERIIEKTGNPKIAAVLAMDLLLVGVDTVSQSKGISQKLIENIFISYSLYV